MFITSAKFTKGQFDENTSMTFEEFIVGICKIVKIHGMKIIDEFIDRYKKIRVKTVINAVDEGEEGDKKDD